MIKILIFLLLLISPGLLALQKNQENKIKQEWAHKRDINFCGMCSLLVGIIENYVASNQTVTRIENSLERICSLLPRNYSVVCVQFVEKYAQLIIDYLVLKESPKTICMQIGMCKSTFSGSHYL